MLTSHNQQPSEQPRSSVEPEDLSIGHSLKSGANPMSVLVQGSSKRSSPQHGSDPCAAPSLALKLPLSPTARDNPVIQARRNAWYEDTHEALVRNHRIDETTTSNCNSASDSCTSNTCDSDDYDDVSSGRKGYGSDGGPRNKKKPHRLTVPSLPVPSSASDTTAAASCSVRKSSLPHSQGVAHPQISIYKYTNEPNAKDSSSSSSSSNNNSSSRPSTDEASAPDKSSSATKPDTIWGSRNELSSKGEEVMEAMVSMAMETAGAARQQDHHYSFYPLRLPSPSNPSFLSTHPSTSSFTTADSPASLSPSPTAALSLYISPSLSPTAPSLAIRGGGSTKPKHSKSKKLTNFLNFRRSLTSLKPSPQTQSSTAETETATAETAATATATTTATATATPALQTQGAGLRDDPSNTNNTSKNKTDKIATASSLQPQKPATTAAYTDTSNYDQLRELFRPSLSIPGRRRLTLNDISESEIDQFNLDTGMSPLQQAFASAPQSDDRTPKLTHSNSISVAPAPTCISELEQTASADTSIARKPSAQERRSQQTSVARPTTAVMSNAAFSGMDDERGSNNDGAPHKGGSISPPSMLRQSVHTEASKQAHITTAEMARSMSAEPRAPTPAMYWSKAKTWGTRPPKMRSQTMNVIGSNLYVFGGWDNKACYNDVYVLDTETMYWSRMETTGDVVVPACRAHTSTVVDQRIFVFGGGDSTRYFSDLYILDTATLSWSKPKVMGKVPTARRTHTCFHYNGSVYLFGGGDGHKALNDLYRISVTPSPLGVYEWVEVETLGGKPFPRGYHTTTLVGRQVVVFGGSDGQECFGDTSLLDLDTLEWTHIAIDPPLTRLAHTSTLVGMYLFVVCGHDGSEYSNQVLMLKLDTLRWETRVMYGNAPIPRGYHACALHDGRLFLHGGYNGQEVFDDLYTLELSSYSYLPQVPPFTIGCHR